jgi:hypothetical protein
MVGMLAVH